MHKHLKSPWRLKFGLPAVHSVLAPAFILTLFFLLSAAVFIGACTSPNKQPEINYHQISSEISRLNEQIMTQADMNSDPGDYLLGPGDLVRISVFEAEELESTVRVNSRGFVTLPLIEKVRLKGLTTMEAEEKIEELYKKRFIKDPHVSLFIEEHFSQRITLVGEFKTPGTYDYVSKQRLLDVIALGGGLSEKAGQIVRIRKTQYDKGNPDTHIVDLDRLVKNGEDRLNIEINGGDVIYIPEAGVYFVDGAVKRPGAYPIRHKTVVQEGIVEAGGTASYAIKDRVKLVRIAENGERQIVDLDLNRPGAKETVIKDRDILIVESNPIAKFFRGFSIHVAGTGISLYDRY